MPLHIRNGDFSWSLNDTDMNPLTTQVGLNPGERSGPLIPPSDYWHPYVPVKYWAVRSCYLFILFGCVKALLFPLMALLSL